MLNKRIKQRIIYWSFLLIFTLIAAEILLRMFNPFPSSVIGDKIILTPNYSKVYFNDGANQSLDRKIIYKRNSIGLRGAEPPADFSSYLTIITIGGSTTECMYISEGKTWEDNLQRNLNDDMNRTWVNNAGFEGHSTFGHIILLRDYIARLHPKICLFLVGVNDVDRKDIPWSDQRFTKTDHHWVLSLAKHSQLVSTLLNLYRNHLARQKNLGHEIHFSLVGKTSLVLQDSIIQHLLQLQRPLLENYDARLREIISICRSNAIEPIFITQPSLMGIGRDSLTGVNLETYPVIGEKNGKLFWQLLELYNDETRKIARESGLQLIDLARKLPRSSAYYYDAIHYNNAGSSEVGRIIAECLVPYLRAKYPQFAKDHQSSASFTDHSRSN